MVENMLREAGTKMIYPVTRKEDTSDACIIAALNERRCRVVSTPASYSVDLGFNAPSGERDLSFRTFMELPA